MVGLTLILSQIPMSKTTLFISFDVETDGSTPSVNNLLSIGFSGLTLDMNEVFSVEYNIKPRETHKPDPETMIWWNKPENAKAWNYITKNTQNYESVFLDFSEKLHELSKSYKILFVAHPACFDWMFFKSYYELVRDVYPQMYPIGFKCICASGLHDIYRQINGLTNSQMTKMFQDANLYDGLEDTGALHTPLYDARIQGRQYLYLYNQLKIMK